MYNKDVSICKRVMLDTINELERKEKETEFATENWRYMMDGLALMKALDVIKKRSQINKEEL